MTPNVKCILGGMLIGVSVAMIVSGGLSAALGAICTTGVGLLAIREGRDQAVWIEVQGRRT